MKKINEEELKELVKTLEEKIAILEDQLDKLKFLNHINEKYNHPGN